MSFASSLAANHRNFNLLLGDQGSPVILALNAAGVLNQTVIKDDSIYNHAAANTGNLVRNSATQQIAPQAFSVEANNGFLQYAVAPEWLFASNDWTIESWVFPTAVDATRRSLYSFNFDGGTNQSWAADFTSGDCRIQCVTTDSTLYTATMGASTFTVNVWQHNAFCRQGDQLLTYLGGTLRGGASGLGSKALKGSTLGSTPRIFRRGDGSQQFAGFMYVRITNGVCWYPNGTAFTPPALPWQI